jgi:protein-arginine kinase activator protein McsA
MDIPHSKKNFEKCVDKYIEENFSSKKDFKEIKDQIKILQDKMKKAIKVENYEVAGVLKLKIQELQQQL